jgi:hypothetical protein
MTLLVQAFVLLFSFAVLFIWKETSLSEFTTPLIGLLVASYLIVSIRNKGRGFLTMGGDGPYGIFIINTLVFLILFQTGSLSSPLFFLLYFLGFGVAFVFEPSAAFIVALGAIIIFFPEVNTNLIDNSVKLLSLLFLSPLAFFFGKQYRKTDTQEEQITGIKERTNEAANTISEDIEEVIKREKENLKEEDVKKLNEVLEETEDLREESKV